METDFRRKVAMLLMQDPRYSEEAYEFISSAVTYTVSKCEKHRHVSGAELLDGIRELAVGQFGVLAKNVLAKWGLIMEEDAGNIVYLLIGAGLLGESEEDSPDDFKTGRTLFPETPVVRSPRRKSDKLPFLD